MLFVLYKINFPKPRYNPRHIRLEPDLATALNINSIIKQHQYIIDIKSQYPQKKILIQLINTLLVQSAPINGTESSEAKPHRMPCGIITLCF